MIAVIVNGLPGSGKTTLAPRLARALDLPLFAKDAVKETIADVIGVTPPPGLTPFEWSRKLGAATNEAIWTLLGMSGRGAVLDDVHEVWCDVPIDVAKARFSDRVADRHAIHFDDLDKSGEWAFWATVAEPLGFGTLHRIDTTALVPDEAIALLATQIPVDRSANAQ